MGRVGGYTLIEVMIFLAISGVLFVSAVALIQGQQGRTQFSQSIRDIDSKITQYATEVSASYFPSTEKYSCSAVAGRPKLTPLAASSKALGSNEDCIVLGKALQFHTTPGSVDDSLTSYTILGLRAFDVSVPGTPTPGNPTPPDVTKQVPVYSLNLANPTPATSLNDTYTLPFGTKITSAKNISGNNSAMASFYVDLSQAGTDASANKSASLVSYQYPGDNPSGVSLSTYPDASSGPVYNCLTLNKTQCSGLVDTPDGPQPERFSNWLLCFTSAASRQKAKITVSSGAAGIQSKVDFDGVGCP